VVPRLCRTELANRPKIVLQALCPLTGVIKRRYTLGEDIPGVEVHEPQPVNEESMNKLITLVAAGGLTLSMLGCAEKAPVSKPVNTPAENKPDGTPAPAPAEPAPPTTEDKK
jgi:hypothetical protein